MAKKPLFAIKSSKARTTPKQVFMHLMMISMLYVAIISFVNLLFQYIDYIYPDILSSTYYGDHYSMIRSASSALVVVFPVFLLTSWAIGKELKAEPEKKEMWIRKWLIYLTLFISAITIVVDLVTLVNEFYSGELTLRFLLKVLVVLLVAILVFAYYLWDMHSNNRKNSVSKIWAVATSVVVLATIIAGFFIAGTPAYQRKLRLDERRVSDLSSIQNEVIYYWQRKDVLPTELSQLNNEISGFRVPTDLETGEAYEYIVTGDLSFKLCATFTNSNESNQDSSEPGLSRPSKGGYTDPYYYGPYEDTWTHGEGRVCFDREIDPALYEIKP